MLQRFEKVTTRISINKLVNITCYSQENDLIQNLLVMQIEQNKCTNY